MPSPVGVTWGVCGIRASHTRLPLQGETPHRRDLGRIHLRQSSPREQPLKEVRVRLHPEESLADGDEAGDVQHSRRIKVLQL